MQVGILQIFQNYLGRSRDEDIVQGEARIARLAETLAGEYKLEGDQALSDTFTFVNDLRARGLLSVA